MAVVVRYFRQQEREATRKIQENNQAQRRQSVARRRDKKGNPKREQTTPSSKGKNDKDTGKRCRLQPEDPCPVHPGMGHKWGECCANAYNCNRDKQGDNKRRKPNDTVDGNMASCDETNSSEITDAAAKMAINDDPLCEDHGTFECEVYVNKDLTITDHHLDAVSFTATQDIKVKGDFPLSHSFTSLCDEVYSSGDSDITLKTFSDITQSC